MFYSLTLGLLHNTLWILFSRPSLLPPLLRPYLRIPAPYPSSSSSLPHSSTTRTLTPAAHRPPQVDYPLWISILFFAAVSLEFFDFPPIAGVLDAHALWHAATVGIVPLWYKFFREDASVFGNVAVRHGCGWM